MDLIKVVTLFLTLFTWMVLAVLNDSEPDIQVNAEKRLMDKLLIGYDRDVRPVKNASHPIQIQLSITLTQIFDMDEKNQVLTTNVWLDQEWVDELLTWDPKDFDGMSTIRVPCERIWLPDIVLYNNADDYTRGYMKSKALVRSNGTVFWPPPTKFRSACPVDVTYFPFDDQTCILKLGSWMYDGFQVDVTNRTSMVDLSNYIPSGEWELLDARIDRNVMYYSCCPEPFPDVTITLVMRRKTLYYMYNIVLPCIMMSVLTLLVFCLPPDSGEKIALGITVLLAFSVFMLAIAEKMPETSESIPLIGIYLTAVMAITSISVIMTVIVLNFHHRGPIKKEVPAWMRCFIVNKYRKLKDNKKSGKAVAESIACPRCSCRNKKAAYKVNIDGVALVNEDGGGANATTGILLGVPDNGNFNGGDFSSNESLNNINDLGHHSRIKTGVQNLKAPTAMMTMMTASTKTGNAMLGSSRSNNKIQDEILKALHSLVQKQEQDEEDMRVISEWRQIATILDRILFWIFLTGTVVSSVSFLVIVPLERRGLYDSFKAI